MRGCQLVSLAFLISCGSQAAAFGATCTVPSGSYPTVGSAVADPACSAIILQVGRYRESLLIGRSLSITGVSPITTTIVGHVRVEGVATLASFDSLAIDAADPAVAGCFVEGLTAVEGARVSGANLEVTNGTGNACLLFDDDFESGTTGAWSSTVP
jgi:hypothetical protein